jgi:hypothetical protein
MQFLQLVHRSYIASEYSHRVILSLGWWALDHSASRCSAFGVGNHGKGSATVKLWQSVSLADWKQVQRHRQRDLVRFMAAGMPRRAVQPTTSAPSPMAVLPDAILQ